VQFTQKDLQALIVIWLQEFSGRWTSAPRFLPIPLILMRIGIYLAKLAPRFRYLTPDMADRMSQDMVFSHEHAASQDFSYSPRSFQP